MITDQGRRVHDTAFQATLLADDLQFRDWTGQPRREELSLVHLAVRSLTWATVELGVSPPRPELLPGAAVGGAAAGVAASIGGLLLVPDPGDPLVLAVVLTAAGIVTTLVYFAVLGLYGHSARDPEPTADLDDAYADLRSRVSDLVAEETAGENREDLLEWLVTAGEFLEMAAEAGGISSSRSTPGEPAGT